MMHGQQNVKFSILIVSFHLLLRLQTGKFPLGLPTKALSRSAQYTFDHIIILKLILNLVRFMAYYYAFFIVLLLPIPY